MKDIILAVLIVGVIACVVIVLAGIRAEVAFERECKERHGYVIKDKRGASVCVSKSVILDVLL
jgi:hypothetical protein